MLKNYGYHLEHNFGHGQQYLAMVLVMLNLLAFLFHTVLDLCDEQYRRVRAELATRQTFFNDVQALTRYLYFDSWQALINFMFTRLELDTDSPSPPRHARQTPLIRKPTFAPPVRCRFGAASVSHRRRQCRGGIIHRRHRSPTSIHTATT